MNPLAKRLMRWTTIGSLAVVLGYFTLLIGNPNELEGKVSSYKLFPHDRCDVLEFENGLVTFKTCCGNSYYGDYKREDGTWIWEYQAVVRRNPPEFKFKEPRRIEVEPGLFSITLRSENGHRLKLPRRVFTKIPL